MPCSAFACAFSTKRPSECTLLFDMLDAYSRFSLETLRVRTHIIAVIRVVVDSRHRRVRRFEKEGAEAEL